MESKKGQDKSEKKINWRGKEDQPVKYQDLSLEYYVHTP